MNNEFTEPELNEIIENALKKSMSDLLKDFSYTENQTKSFNLDKDQQKAYLQLLTGYIHHNEKVSIREIWKFVKQNLLNEGNIFKYAFVTPFFLFKIKLYDDLDSKLSKNDLGLIAVARLAVKLEDFDSTERELYKRNVLQRIYSKEYEEKNMILMLKDLIKEGIAKESNFTNSIFESKSVKQEFQNPTNLFNEQFIFHGNEKGVSPSEYTVLLKKHGINYQINEFNDMFLFTSYRYANLFGHSSHFEIKVTTAFINGMFFRQNLKKGKINEFDEHDDWYNQYDNRMIDSLYEIINMDKDYWQSKFNISIMPNSEAMMINEINIEPIY